MSTATVEAAGFIRRLIKEESNGWGDEANALKRICRDYRLPFWTLNNIRIGRAKKCDGDIRDRIRSAFIEHCRSQAARLLHEAEIAAAKGNKNDGLEGIADQIRALAIELEAAKGEPEIRR